MDELLAAFREFTGDQPRYLRLPSGIMLPIAEIASFYLSRAHPTFNQRFTPGAIRHLRQQRWANTSKAREELGLQALAEIVETGPDPEVDGVVRWRRVDLQRLIEKRFKVVYCERRNCLRP